MNSNKQILLCYSLIGYLEICYVIERWLIVNGSHSCCCTLGLFLWQFVKRSNSISSSASTTFGDYYIDEALQYLSIALSSNGDSIALWVLESERPNHPACVELKQTVFRIVLAGYQPSQCECSICCRIH